MGDGTLDGTIILYLLIAAVLTFVTGVGALVLLQRSILRHMRATHGVGGGATPTERPRQAASGPLVLMAEDSANAPKGTDPTRYPLFRIALAHAVAGLVFAIAAALLLLTFGGLELFPVRTAMVVWAQAWPAVLVLCLLVGP